MSLEARRRRCSSRSDRLRGVVRKPCGAAMSCTGTISSHVGRMPAAEGAASSGADSGAPAPAAATPVPMSAKK